MHVSIIRYWSKPCQSICLFLTSPSRIQKYGCRVKLIFEKDKILAVIHYGTFGNFRFFDLYTRHHIIILRKDQWARFALFLIKNIRANPSNPRYPCSIFFQLLVVSGNLQCNQNRAPTINYFLISSSEMGQNLTSLNDSLPFGSSK